MRIQYLLQHFIPEAFENGPRTGVCRPNNRFSHTPFNGEQSVLAFYDVCIHSMFFEWITDVST